MKSEVKEFSSRVKITMLVVVILIAITVPIIFIMYLNDNTNAKFIVSTTKEDINIFGWGGANISKANVTEVKLLSKAPEVNYNDGGGSNSHAIYGDENLVGLGDTSCFVKNLNSNAILIKTKKEQYLIAYENPTETKNLYEKIKTI